MSQEPKNIDALIIGAGPCGIFQIFELGLLGIDSVIIDKNEDYLVTTSNNNQFITKTIFIAGGVGSFQARKIKLKDIDSFEDKWLHYKIRNKKDFIGKNLVIFGGGDSALDWTNDFANDKEFIDSGGKVTLVHRRDEYRGAG